MRILFFTVPKSGSQWIRDLIAAPEILTASGVTQRPDAPYFPLPVEEHLGSEPVPDGTFLGPVYNRGMKEILPRLGPRDRALVVGRDPRDLLVSHLFSLLHSHDADSSVPKQLLHGALSVAPIRDQLRLMVHLAAPFVTTMISWRNSPRDPRLMYTTYEDVLADTPEFLRGWFAHLGLAVPDARISRLVTENSFAARSGRIPGQEDTHSHFRKGQPGDWRRFFNRELGQAWELRHAGSLRCLGLETDGRWWEALPEEVPGQPDVPSGDRSEGDLSRALAALAKERESRLIIERAASERLEALQRLDAQAKQLLAQCQEKEQVIQELRQRLDAQTARLAATHRGNPP